MKQFEITFRPTMTEKQLTEDAPPYDVTGWLRVRVGKQTWGAFSEESYFADSAQGVWLISWFCDLARICCLLSGDGFKDTLYLHDIETPHEGLSFTRDGEFAQIMAISANWPIGSGSLCEEAPEILALHWPHAIPVHLHDMIREVKEKGEELSAQIGLWERPLQIRCGKERLDDALSLLPTLPPVPQKKTLPMLLAELVRLGSPIPPSDALCSEILDAIQEEHPEYCFTAVAFLGEAGKGDRMVIYQDNGAHLDDFSTFTAEAYDGMDGEYGDYRVETLRYPLGECTES